MVNGQVPSPYYGLGGQEAEAKALVAQQLAQLSISIYSAATATVLSQNTQPRPPGDFENLAKQAHQAARAYFEGLGLAKFNKDTQ